MDGEGGPLAAAIVEAFEAEATANGAGFMVIVLPGKADLPKLRDGKPLPYAELLERLEERHHVIRTEPGFDLQRPKSYFEGHYTPEGNEIVARAAFSGVMDWMEVNREELAIRLRRGIPDQETPDLGAAQ